MLKQCFTLFLTSFCIYVHAQNNLIVLSEKGKGFLLFVDGKPMNDSSQVLVKAEGLYNDTCNIKLLFADKKLPSFEGKAYLTIAGKSAIRKEFTYSLEEMKGKRNLRFISANDIISDTTSS